VFIRQRSSQPPDERGSLIVVLAVIMVLSLICAAVAAEVIGNEVNVLSKSNSATAVSAADAGLTDALFRLDQLTPATASSFCVDATGTGTWKGVSPNVTCDKAPNSLSGASYTALGQYTGTLWTVQSEATAKGITAAVQETISYSAKYPYAIFGNSGLDFNGQNPGGVGAYNEGKANSTNPDASTADCTNGVGTSCVKVGSNGPIKCAGGLSGNVSEVYYTGGGGAGACSNPIPDPSRYVLSIPTAPPGVSPNCPGVAQTPVNGVTVYEIGSNVPGWGTLAAGTYYCPNEPLEINGNLTVSGPVSMYIILDDATNNTMINGGMQTLYITGGSEVNATFDGTAGPPPPGTTLPVAANLQILSNSTGTVGSANGGGANGPYTYGGIIYAPNANLVGNGCKSAYYGAITINTLTCNGGPHLQVYYDNALATLYGPPVVSGYAQINPQTVNIP
jgi:Tfp pilus assembly protein PilX